MRVANHAISGKSVSRCYAYGVNPWAVAKVLRTSNDRPAGSVGVVLARSKHLVSVGGSVGRYLVAIIRNGKMVTILNSHSAAASHLRVGAVQWAA